MKKKKKKEATIKQFISTDNRSILPEKKQEQLASKKQIFQRFVNH